MTDAQKGELSAILLEVELSLASEGAIFAYVDTLVAEVRAPLVALLRELANHPRFGRDVFDWNMQVEGCRFCMTEEENGGEIHHPPECLVTRVRALLANEGQEP